MNNLSYGYSPSNNSSFSSFSSQYASTPSSTRFQRPRFGYAGPPSYPRPRSSASKPNPDSYSDNYQNSTYDSNSLGNGDSYRNDTTGSATNYTHGYMDSMQNNYGDSTLPPNNSLTMTRSRDSYNDPQASSNSSAYFTCNESLYPTPQKLPPYSTQQNDNLHSGLLDRGGFSYSDADFNKRTNTYFNLDSGRSAGFDQGGLSGFGTGRGRGTSVLGTFGANNKGANFRGKAGNFGKNRGIARGGFQKNKNFSKGNKLSNNPPMAPKLRCEICAIDFTSSIPYDMHLRGARHLKKLKTQTALSSIQTQISQVTEIEQQDGKKYYCEVCAVIANSSLQLQMHLDGTKHKNKLEQLKNPKEESKENPEDKGPSDKIENKANTVNTEQVNANGDGVRAAPANGGVIRAAPADFGEPQPSKMTKFSCDICSIVVNSNTQLQQHLSSKKHQAKVEGKPLVKKKKMPKGEEDSEEPMNQDESSHEEATNKEVTNVVGVKTLSASFVQGGTLQ